jgi:hypothetical protein
MKNLIILSTILLTFISCGKKSHTPLGNPTPNPTLTDLQEFVDRFEDEFNVVVNMPVSFSDTKSAGVCYYGSHVEINESYWYGISDLQKEQLIFHELGHCVFNRRHTNNVNKEGFMFSGFLINTKDNKFWAYTWAYDQLKKMGYTDNEMKSLRYKNLICPMSIMTTTSWLDVTLNGCYVKHKDYYLEELRHGHRNDVGGL